MAAAPPLEQQPDVVAFLGEGTAFGGETPRRIDTHAAYVFLTRDRAWKLKRAVRFPYLDFSTPELRREAFEAEFALNRRAAPELYLAVRPITRAPDGSLAIDGAGEPIDWVLEMRRFPDEALMTEVARAGGLHAGLTRQLADTIVAFHRKAGPVEARGSLLVEKIIAGNEASFREVSSILDPAQVAALTTAQRRELAAHAGQLDNRGRAGRVRHGHGDLHLANIALIDGEPVLFDCIEFSSELATVDILYDLAFLLMDLWYRGLKTQANQIANRYLDIAPQGASGYTLLPLFISVRAAIRAHVRAAASLNGGGETVAEEARSYLALAGQVLEPAQTELLAVGGLSGTGKSTVAAILGARLGRAPGARVLRSDVFRKRLAGVPPETRLPARSYTKRANAETYTALFESANDHLLFGTSVVLDAVFGSRSERDVAESLGTRDRVPFTGLWLEAPEADRLARVHERTGDASDATWKVVHEQSRRSVGELAHWHRMKANRPLEAIIAAARGVLERHRH